MPMKHCAAALALAAVVLAGPLCADADVVTDANARAADVASKFPGTPPAVRIMAFVQVSVFEAVNAITGRYPPLQAKINAAPGSSVDAAVAAATRTALSKLMPAQQAAIDADYEAALKLVPDGPAKSNGIAVGEQAATACLTRVDEGLSVPDTYRPHAAAGVYVPTMLPAVPNWGKRKPWVMTSGSQFRPAPPPALTSETWTRDYNEIKAVGAKNSTRRTPEQTAMAKFWEATAPAVYWPVARSVAAVLGRDVTANARLLAIAAMAMDDALIAVFDAKYTYNLWRPITAIRNGDVDGNDATERDPSWTPFIDTPMHPEYPCAHCIVSASLGAVLQAELGSGPTPTLSSASSTAGGAVRTWKSVGDFVREVAEARICDGVHYRFSTEVGASMGKQIGELAVKSFPKPIR
ncbi:MAG: PA-phosphatase [Candidatus Rokuibacteriota bacterium]|nr:MAG: PA-phosphatase [Candidatus Rokubacteria bacterium]PYO14280.1 MAG: PA-phosphatase [Candidatus Rokubacteria bacterium]